MISIKEYEEERDFESIVESCRKEQWVRFYGPKKDWFRQALKTSESYVAFVDDQYAGFVRALTDGFFTIFCCEIIVEKEYRRQGVGKALLQTLNDKYPSCVIDVISDNDAFYEANGFKVLANGMRQF